MSSATKVTLDSNLTDKVSSLSKIVPRDANNIQLMIFKTEKKTFSTLKYFKRDILNSLYVRLTKTLFILWNHPAYSFNESIYPDMGGGLFFDAIYHNRETSDKKGR